MWIHSLFILSMLDNCRWATKKEQQNNMSSNRYIEYQNKSKTISQWGESTGLGHKNISERLRRGWTIEETLKTPLIKQQKLNNVCIQVIKHFYHKGISITKLAKVHNLSYSTIRRAILA